MSFYAKLEAAWRHSGSQLCVGLDPDPERLPRCLSDSPRPYFDFCRAIVDATADLACAYKPQFAHFAAAGRTDELRELMSHIRAAAPQAIRILDYKRGDIGSTAHYYAIEGFEHYFADAVTVNPYLGGDALEPFTSFRDHGVIVLCRTSNPGSAELQGLRVEGGRELYLHVAEKAATEWNGNGNLALVVGATYPEELAKVRSLVGDMPILVPGIGAQGGDLRATLKAGRTSDGAGLLINSSRGILYASDGGDFADAARAAALDLWKGAGFNG